MLFTGNTSVSHSELIDQMTGQAVVDGPIIDVPQSPMSRQANAIPAVIDETTTNAITRHGTLVSTVTGPCEVTCTRTSVCRPHDAGEPPEPELVAVWITAYDERV